ncbi:MAG: polysaccharide deacetylase family protein [Roseiflexaceae bacterium]|nr:polysaccharide deacetylase family protein [Roseiflexaceae bacterium]
MSTFNQRGVYHYNELLHEGHRFLEKRFPSALWHGDPLRPEIALTFDDGPSLRDLDAILRTLDAHGAVATFFFIGAKVAAAAALVRAVAAAGHQIGMHGYRHRPFTSLKPTLLRLELRLAQTLISRICGWERERVRDIRPPFGVFTPTTLALLERWHYRAVMWSLVPFHWRFAAELSFEQVRRRVTAGSLIVLHEDMSDGPTIVELLDHTLPIVRQAGLRTVTVEDMWRARDATSQHSELS